ncbi:MAG: hypothetical protein KF862_03985 [Chitinophagaceae bacterium]|nr:hypothetical protein [Chitinophagaceae bacterium]
MEKEIQIPFRAAKLIIGYLHNSLTEVENDELDDWVGQSDDNMKIFEQLTDQVDEGVFKLLMQQQLLQFKKQLIH